MSAARPDDFVGEVDRRSGLVEAGAAATLERIDGVAHVCELGLGPLTPKARSLTLGAFLEGPYAGLRAVRGGRLEPACAAITARLPSGHAASSNSAPRSAAGPDLDALFLGAEGRFGRVASAVLRLTPAPGVRRHSGFAFADAARAVDALAGAVAAGVWLERALLQRRGDGFAFAAVVIGSAPSVERDLGALEGASRRRGGRPSAHEALGAHDTGRSDEERELSWAEVERAAEEGAALELFRLSLESVVAVGAGEAGVPLSAGGWTHEALWSAVAGSP